MFITQKKVTTNKPHKCWGCSIEYPAKTEMERNVSTDNGKIFSVYYCQTCVDFLDSIPMGVMPEFWCEGELKEMDGYPVVISKTEEKDDAT